MRWLLALRIKPIFAWYDFYIGAYWDRHDRKLYLMALMVGVVISFAKEPESAEYTWVELMRTMPSFILWAEQKYDLLPHSSLNQFTYEWLRRQYLAERGKERLTMVIHLAAPGTEGGPCMQACKHPDCARLRNLLNATCRHCGKPIGTRGFYDEPPADPDFNAEWPHTAEYRQHLIHQVCLRRQQSGLPTGATRRHNVASN